MTAILQLYKESSRVATQIHSSFFNSKTMAFPSIHLLVMVLLVKAAFGAYYNITSLPGYSGDLPFPLESGYVGVGNDESVQLFYLFAESRGNPSTDPILLWITGGPGCSSLRAFFFEHGPLTFDYDNYPFDGSIPTLIPNNYTWTKRLSILYLDGPAGTGYSYATTTEAYQSGDFMFVAQIYEFLRKWLLEHPQFSSNDMYLGGDGYSGNLIAMLTEEVLLGNAAGIFEPFLNVKGYVLGNPGADFNIDFNARTTFSNRLALISDDIYESAYVSCNGNFITPPNSQCQIEVDYMTELTSNINAVMVLEPACKDVPNFLKMKPHEINSIRRSLEQKYSDSYDAPTQWCRKYNHMLCSIWANYESVQDALHVYYPEGSPVYWQSCNDSIIVGPAFNKSVSSVVAYHKNLTETNIQGLIYSGDHDMEISYIGTQKWIRSLDLTLSDKWRAWTVNNETAGYTKGLTSNYDFNLTFVTVKGAGHFAAEYKVQECYEMIDRWMSNDPL